MFRHDEHETGDAVREVRDATAEIMMRELFVDGTDASRRQ